MKRPGARVLAAAVVLAAVSGLTLAAQRPGRVARPAPGVAVAKEEGLVFRLREGADEPGGRAPVASPAPATALSAADTERVLQRLPPMEAEPTPPPFALRESSLPPPRTGATVKDPFPPPPSGAGPGSVATGPLEVLRHAPDGEVPLSANLSVTFSQAMVDLTSVSELAAEASPVRLTPQPPGRWRWVGTRTLLFEPEGGRFPMATDYTAEVPAGTRAATGALLDKAVKWAFGTPPPALVASHPGNTTVRRDAVMFAAFDQRIDPAAVLAAARAGAGAVRPALRLATPEEVAADDVVKDLAARAGEGRWLALRAQEPLPADTAVTVTLPAGTPSAEGPRRTAKDQSWTFHTFGPLKLVETRCGWSDQCPPGSPWQLHFSNPIDPASLGDGTIRVEPPLPAQAVDVFNDWIRVRGRSRARTKYTITVAATLRDQFGQDLGQPATTTVTTTAAQRQLISTSGQFVVLDPGTPPRFSVWSAGIPKVRARAFAVTPGDWPRFMSYVQEAWRNLKGATPPGRPVFDTTLAVVGDRDELAETRVDLAPALPGGLGNLLLIVDAVDPTAKADARPRPVMAWVQSTRIGLSAFADAGELLVWANALADGAPRADVRLEPLGGGAMAVTDAQGLARIPLSSQATWGVLARHGADSAFLPSQPNWWSEGVGWRQQAPGPQLAWMVFDDRGMYRPGEEVKLKGWARVVGQGKGGDVEAWQQPVREVAYALRDPQGNEVAKGSAPINEYGGFELSLKLPEAMNLGTSYLSVTAAGWAGSTSHPLQVQEFRRPEYEVTSSASQAPHFVGGTATVAVSAQYYAGGSLANTPVGWSVSAAQTTYRPPNRDDFTFGRWTPWWEYNPSTSEGATRQRTLEGRTDGGGRHVLAIDFESVDPALPSSVTAEATVTDVNRQAWTARSVLLVHPSDTYVGLRLQKPFVERGARYAVEAVATDLDGGAVAGRAIEVIAQRLEWKHGAKGWEETPVDAGRCALTSTAGVVRCDLRADEGGSYRIRATVSDARGRKSLSETRIWVSGGKTAENRGLEQEKVTLVPDKREYRVGDTAEVLVVSPLVPAEGLLTLRRSGLVRSERFRLTDSTHVLRIPIEEGFVSNLHVQVDLVGAAARDDAKNVKRPAYASGRVALSIPPASRTLAVAVATRDKALSPGGQTSVELLVKDAAGRPVPQGEVAVVVVDEAVLALTGYKLPDPLALFYQARQPGVSDHHLRAHVTLGVPAEPAEERELDRLGYTAQASGAVEMYDMAAPAPGARPAAPPPPPPPAAKAMRSRQEAAPPEPIRMRSDFTALALFAASVVTDAEGRAQVPLKVPDSLTRYRVMAVAATRGNQFGSAEGALTVRLPLMVRPSAPRFLNFGDTFELPVVVQNQTDRALPVDVVVRAQGLALTSGAGRRVNVPAHDRVEVRFPMAVERVGTARVQVGAASGGDADAAQVSLPVWTPATTEAFAVYGTIDGGGVVQPVRPPAGVIPQFGGLEMTTSSTALQSLTDAVIYLVSYPFECSEQLSSRVLGVAALRDVLAAFQAEGLPAPKEMEAAVARDLELLRRLQNDDGGFPFWRRGDPSWPYVSIHVALALERAKAKGFSVPGNMQEQVHGYLKSIDSRIPRDYPLEARRTLVAYALNVRHKMGDSDPARAKALLREAGVDKLSFEALGWLLPVLGKDSGSRVEADSIRRRLANNVAETAGAAHFAVSYGESGPYLLLSSDRRADAVVLEALIGDQPKSDLIPKIVTGLLGHRRAGRWLNTQENVFILLALDRYFQAYEKVTPDFVARAWLGESLVSEQGFHGRSTDRHQVEVPMAFLAEGGRRDLTLTKEGPGRLYYRLGLRYAPQSLHLDPLDAGFTVERRYEAIDDPADVRRADDGSWQIKAGARVRVRLTLASVGRRNHVALVDPLPAGLEALNPALATTGTLPPAPDDTVGVMGAPGLGGPGRGGHWWWWRRTWFEHQNLRDERVEAFTSLLFEGVYTYSYVARATTPGAFVVPPTKAEEMYHPETFGRAGTDRVVVR
jgi:alpha-2-macroglobulin